MRADEFLQYSALREKNITQANIIHVESVSAEPEATKPDLTGVYDTLALLMPVGFIAFWGMFLFMSTDIGALARHGLLSLKNWRQAPCKNCQFFSNNPYLRCALHPSSAMTPQAINCSDYCPKSSSANREDSQEKRKS